VHGTNWISQSFTGISTHFISQIQLYLAKGAGTTVGPVTVSLRNVTGDEPTGSDLASGTVDGNSLMNLGGSGNLVANYELVTITLSSPVQITVGTKLAVIIRATTADSNALKVFSHDNVTGTYADGAAYYTNNSGGSWNAVATRDHAFIIDGTLNFPPPDTDGYTSKHLIAVAKNEVWYESTAGTMAQLVASVGTLNTTDFLSMFEAYGKAFIVNNIKKKVVDFVNSKLSTNDVGANPPDFNTVLIGGSSGAKMVVDYITTLSSACTIYGKRTTTATFTSGETVTGTDDDGNAISFVLSAAEVAGPHYYDWTVFGGSSNFGVIPDNATLGCLYNGRNVISGDSNAPHQWYMSRVGNPFNFLFGLNDAQSAVAGGDSDAGEVGDIVTALIPYKDEYLVIGCASSIWYIIGDPTNGGSLNELDLTTGIYGQRAWCFDGSGNFYFWGTNGLYRCSIPGTPVCVSQIRLPNLVGGENVDPSTHRIVLSYDRANAGIHVAVTKLSDGTNSNYFYDLRTTDDSGIAGFFPEVYPEECGVYSTFYYESKDTTYRKLLVGCTDGYLRWFDPTAKSDDIGATDEAIDSFIDYGPIQMGADPRMPGLLTRIDVVLAGGNTGGSQSDSDPVYFKVFEADSAEEVIEELVANTSPKIAGTFRVPGKQRQNSLVRKVSGYYMGFKIGNNTAAETWAFEQLIFDNR
jgi:hypothetical protein